MTTPRSESIALIGYRATGKSTVGRILADRLGWRFVDADQEIEARAGSTINRLFSERGEAAFRELEAQAIASLAGQPRTVLATGGGAVLREDNREALRRVGLIVYLATDPDCLVQRLRMDPGDRPPLTDQGLLNEVREVLAVREPYYRALADLEIQTGSVGPDEVADQILRHWNSLDPGATPP